MEVRKERARRASSTCREERASEGRVEETEEELEKEVGSREEMEIPDRFNRLM